ncbi:MAG: CapA family protein, partial [Chitinophagales bacterium]
KYVRQPDGTYNFSPCFSYIKPFLENADLMIGNLETTFAGERLPYSGFPLFNTPDAYATALKEAGFNFIITGNNHSNDTDTRGIVRTISVLDSLGLPHTGTFSAKADRDSIRLVEIQNTSIAILNYTYSTNGNDLPPGKEYMVNLIDSTLILQDISASKKAGAELIIIYYHYGNEYERLPSAYQKKYTELAVHAGADIILGSHPHVLQPADFFPTNNGNIDTGFVIYSMGNFISNQRDPHTYEGIIVNLHFKKNEQTKKLSLEKTDYVPTWVYRGTNNKKLHVVFPALDTSAIDADFLLPADRIAIENAKNNTARLMESTKGRFIPINR